MAATSGFITRVYGAVEGAPPYTDASGATAFSRVLPFNTTGIWSLPSTPVNIVPLPNGFQMPSGFHVYTVIQLPPSGLNVHGTQLVTDTSAATLATNRG